MTTETILSKEIGQYRVKLVKKIYNVNSSQTVVLVTDKKECDREVITIFPTGGGKQCFDSIGPDSIDRLNAFREVHKEYQVASQALKESFGSGVEYASLDMASERILFGARK